MERHKILNSKRKNKSKRELLKPRLTGDVLHVGFLGSGPDAETTKYVSWLHEWVDNQAETLVGIDIDSAGVDRATELGYECYTEDAESFKLDQSFDTILAANVIEHLSNPGSFLDTAHEHLRHDGRLLITTPRTFTPWNFARELKSGISPPDEHVMWFCRETLQSLLNRAAFDIVNYERWGFKRVGTVWYEKIFNRFEQQVARLPWFEDITKIQHFIEAHPVSD